MFEWGDRYDITGGFYVGIADRIYYQRRNKVKVGYVGFWEIDDTLPDGYQSIIESTGKTVHLFTTERGFHFVSFTIMSFEEKLQWRTTMGRLGGQYPLFKENCLRISAKNGLKPRYAFTVGETTGDIRDCSSYHIRAYRPLFGIHYPILSQKWRRIHTNGHVFLYYADPDGVIEDCLKDDIRRIAGVGRDQR